jgi:endonuclease/exonuclease/phosphatase family metal-dependent hydrolase
VLFATYNIQYGVGQDGAFDLAGTADAVRAADVICFQEVAQHWERDGRIDQVAALAQSLDYYAVFGTGLDVDASFRDEHGLIVNRRRTLGNMVASRWPIRSARTLPLPHEPLANHGDVQRCAVEAVIDAPGLSLRVYSVHLSHTSSSQRSAQIQHLLDVVRKAPTNGAPWDFVPGEAWPENARDATLPGPAIIMGDLNLTARAPEYTLLAGDLHPLKGRLVRHDGLFDAWVLAGNAEDEGSTLFGAREPGYRIDHAFVTPALRAAVGRAWIDESVTASDHYPLFVEINPRAQLQA